MDSVERVVGRIAWRLGAAGMVRAAARALCAALAVAVVLVLAERLLALGVSVGAAVAVPVAVGAAAGVGLGLARWPGRLIAAVRADGALGLDERLSSALSAGDGPMADLVRADAARCAEALDVAASFPLTLSPPARALPLLGVLLAVAVLLPGLDLLGRGRARDARAARAAELRHAASQARSRLRALRDAARQEGLGQAARVLDDAAARVGAAAEAAGSVQASLDAALNANHEARNAADAPDRIRELLRERDLLVRASRAVEDLGRQVAGATGSDEASAAAKRPTTAAGAEPAPRSGLPVLQQRDTEPPPQSLVTLERRLLEARPAAEQAVSRDDVPWRYRALVKRYFSPDEPLARSGQ